VVTSVYLAIGYVVYYYCGSYVASPALGSAGPTMKKISYGFALPGLIASTMLVVHVSLKSILRYLLCTRLTEYGCLPSTSLSGYCKVPDI
jgi:hypothetical protein